MAGVGLNHHWTARRKSGRGIAAQDGECEREIACREHRYRSNGNAHPSQVGPPDGGRTSDGFVVGHREGVPGLDMLGKSIKLKTRAI